MKAETAINLVKTVAPRLGYDYTNSPVFPEGRDDLCAVRHTAENGHSYGYDVIFLVWEEEGKIEYKEIANSRISKDYIFIDSVSVLPDKIVEVKFRSGGSFSGSPWSDSSFQKIN